MHIDLSSLRNSAEAQSVRAFASQGKRWVFESQVTTDLLLHVNAHQQAWVLQVLGDDHYKRMRPVTVGVARKTMAMTTEHRSKLVALHRQWWRIDMREKFSIGTNNPKQKKNRVCMWKSNWWRVYSYHEFISEVTFSIQIKNSDIC